MRVLEMDPEKERLRARLGEPRERSFERLRRAALERARTVRLRAGELVVVHVEPAVAPAARPEHRVTDEGRRIVPLPLERFGERLHAAEHQQAVAEPRRMPTRVAPGHHRRVRGAGVARGGNGAIEDDAARGQGVDVRAGLQGLPVAVEMIGAQRVDGDEQHVPRTARGPERPQRERGQQPRHRQRDRRP